MLSPGPDINRGTLASRSPRVLICCVVPMVIKGPGLVAKSLGRLLQMGRRLGAWPRADRVWGLSLMAHDSWSTRLIVSGMCACTRARVCVHVCVEGEQGCMSAVKESGALGMGEG